MCKQEWELGFKNWLSHDTWPVCHYTDPGCVTYQSGILEFCIGIETYTGLRWLHGLGYTGTVTFVLRKFFKLVPCRDLHRSLQITLVQLQDPCTCVSPWVILAFFQQRVTRICGFAYTTHVLYINSNSQSLDLSKLFFALLYSGASPKHLK